MPLVTVKLAYLFADTEVVAPQILNQPAVLRTIGIDGVTNVRVGPVGGELVAAPYDPASGAWRTFGPMPMPRHSIPAAVAGGRIYLPGGTPRADSLRPRNVISEVLPYFDAFAVGGFPRELLFPGRAWERALAGGQAGNFPVLLVDGVVTGVFQEGFGASLLGVDSGIPIVSFVPVMMFAILFGLSMDYNVFLLSRIHEAYNEGDRPRESVIHGMSRLGQVISNLLVNAQSFSNGGGKVRIACRRVKSEIEIVVDDDGPGIREDALERVFERFYTDRPHQGFGQNSGLGLSISKQIIEAHGGRIWAENRPGPANADAEATVAGELMAPGGSYKRGTTVDLVLL